MTSEFHELLSVSDDETVQIWIIGRRDRVAHTMNEFCAGKITADRMNFTPIVPTPLVKGKYMTILIR